MTVTKLNSTGTCKQVNSVYFSYHQQMTANYKGYHLYDIGFYSMTTSKHQTLIERVTNKSYDLKAIDLYHANFNKGIEWSIENEIEYLEHDIEKLQTKRKTKKTLETIDKYTKKIIILQRLLNE